MAVLFQWLGSEVLSNHTRMCFCAAMLLFYFCGLLRCRAGQVELLQSSRNAFNAGIEILLFFVLQVVCPESRWRSLQCCRVCRAHFPHQDNFPVHVLKVIFGGMRFAYNAPLLILVFVLESTLVAYGYGSKQCLTLTCQVMCIVWCVRSLIEYVCFRQVFFTRYFWSTSLC